MKLIDILQKMKVSDLKKEIDKQNIKGYSKLKKAEIIKIMTDRADKFKYLLLQNMEQKKELLKDKIKLKEAKEKLKKLTAKKAEPKKAEPKKQIIKTKTGVVTVKPKKEERKLTEIEKIRIRLEKISNIKGGLMNPNQKKELKKLLDERERLREKMNNLLKKKLEEPKVAPKPAPKKEEPKKEPKKEAPKPAPKKEPKKEEPKPATNKDEAKEYIKKILETNKKIKLFNRKNLEKKLNEKNIDVTRINQIIDSKIKDEIELFSKTDIISDKDIDVFKKGSGKLKNRMFNIINDLEKLIFNKKTTKPAVDFINFLNNETNKREKLYIAVKIQQSFDEYCNKLEQLEDFIKIIKPKNYKNKLERIKFLDERCLDLMDIMDDLQDKFNITSKQIKDNELMIF